MEKEANIWKISVFVDENKNEEGKGGKNMEKEFCGQTGGQADIKGSIRGPREPKNF